MGTFLSLFVVVESALIAMGSEQATAFAQAAVGAYVPLTLGLLLYFSRFISEALQGPAGREPGEYRTAVLRLQRVVRWLIALILVGIAVVAMFYLAVAQLGVVARILLLWSGRAGRLFGCALMFVVFRKRGTGTGGGGTDGQHGHEAGKALAATNGSPGVAGRAALPPPSATPERDAVAQPKTQSLVLQPGPSPLSAAAAKYGPVAVESMEASSERAV